ncbi:MAG: GLUG motif-containing protein [Chitinophagales bacterium]
MKKIYLILILILSHAGLQAQFSGGNGTVANPYQISTKADLKTLCDGSSYWASHFIQTADILFIGSDFSSTGNFYYGGQGFSPIGNVTTQFTGSYDGQGHIIDGVYINRVLSNEYISFFGYASTTGTIQNLGLTNADIKGKNYVGGMFGYVKDATITNCYATGTVEVSLNYAGGLIGYASNTTILNCYSECTVNNIGTGPSYLGGLIGRNLGSITNSYATGNINGSNNASNGSNFVGGFVGYSHASTATPSPINNCYASGNVTGNSTVGGFMGYCKSPIANCYALGGVVGNMTVGGFVGNSWGTINNSYSAGSVSGSTDVGGFIGYNDAGTISNCFWNTQTSGQTSSSGGGTTGITTLQMKNETTFTNATWDFEGETTNGTADIWKMGCSMNNDYPYLFWQIAPASTLTADSLSTTITPITCNGGNDGAIDLTVAGTSNPYSYAWSNSTNTEDIAGLSAGTYTVTVTDANNCSATVSTIISEPAMITGTDVQTSCGAFTWIDGNTYTSSNNTATFTLAGGAANGCDSTVTLNLTINNNQSITTTTSDLTITANETGASYQWIDCNDNNNSILGETNQSFTATANGSYAVMVYSGSCSDTSDCVEINTVGIKNIVETNFANIYPNPAKDFVIIETGSFDNYNIELYNAIGNLVFSKEINSDKITVSTQSFVAGVYFVTIKNQSAKQVTRLVIK